MIPVLADPGKNIKIAMERDGCKNDRFHEKDLLKEKSRDEVLYGII